MKFAISVTDDSAHGSHLMSSKELDDYLSIKNWNPLQRHDSDGTDILIVELKSMDELVKFLANTGSEIKELDGEIANKNLRIDYLVEVGGW